MTATMATERRCVACGLPITQGAPTFAGWCLDCHTAFPRGVVPHDEVTPFLRRRIVPMLDAERAARAELLRRLGELHQEGLCADLTEESTSVALAAGIAAVAVTSAELARVYQVDLLEARVELARLRGEGSGGDGR